MINLILNVKYNNKFLGTIGDIGVFSFHETKNLVGGQAGCISINNSSFIKRANYILDKGTNRKQFINNFKKKIIPSNKKGFYSWIDIGSDSKEDAEKVVRVGDSATFALKYQPLRNGLAAHDRCHNGHLRLHEQHAGL